MESVEEAPSERVEAVIISGPRRGEIITLPEAEHVFTPKEEALVDEMLVIANRMAETARSIAEQARATVEELRRNREAREEAFGPGRSADD